MYDPDSDVNALANCFLTIIKLKKHDLGMCEPNMSDRKSFATLNGSPTLLVHLLLLCQLHNFLICFDVVAHIASR